MVRVYGMAVRENTASELENTIQLSVKGAGYSVRELI